MFEEKQLWEVFSIAVDKEREAQQLYTRAAELAAEKFPELSEEFRRMVADEKAHEERLVLEYANYKRTIQAE